MPTYTFEDTKTGKVFDDYMSIADKEAYLKKNKHIKQLITSINIVSGTGGMKNDSGGKKTYPELQKHTQPVHLQIDMVRSLSKI